MPLHGEDISVKNVTAAAKAFSRQAAGYDAADRDNPVLRRWRKLIYRHVEQYLKPGDCMLELNAGTGIDAAYFASKGYSVHATDAAPGMIEQIAAKAPGLNGSLTFQQCSFAALDQVVSGPFGYIFSNFGGLNCIANLGLVTRHLPGLMKPGATGTWVVMPPVCPWEMLSVLRGSRQAFRRLRRGGAPANVEGINFMTYYHTLRAVKKSLGSHFRVIKVESLGTFSPPPASAGFERPYPRLASVLRALDNSVRHFFPFNHTGDHIIITFRYDP